MTRTQLLTCKELAYELRRSVKYVYTMKRLGFQMIGGRATLYSALRWLKSNPEPTKKRG